MNKKFMTLSIAVALLVVATITISSYAYFTISNKEGEESVITSGTMSLLFTDGNEISANNLLPGQSVEKEFTVKNTGNLDTMYDVYLSDVINNFVDRTDLVYELTSTDGGYNTTSQVEVPNRSAKIVNEQSISVNDTHHYRLKITFLNKDENQDDNQGKVFSAKIQINEYKDIEINTNYYLDNELVTTLPNQLSTNYVNNTCDKGATITFDTTDWTYTTNILQNNTTCNLYFETKQFTLTYNYNYEGSTSTTKQLTYGQQYGTLPSPTRPGWTFQGWYTATTGGTQVSASNTISENTTIYARWQQIGLATYIKSLVGKDSTVVEDNTTDKNVRYVGSTVNNYVSFNNEKWRIIGVFGNYVKIMKHSNIGSMKYNDSLTYLNGDYYNGLNATYKNMVQSYSWRTKTATRDAKAINNYNSEKNQTTSRYVSLINLSDYQYASPSSCWTVTAYDYYKTCATQGWIYTSTTDTSANYLVLNKNAYASGGPHIIKYNGEVNTTYDSEKHRIMPSLYLKNTVKVTVSSTSNGTSTYPYQISM